MSEQDKTGGPAFPKAGLDPWQRAMAVQVGMTLRDYFAAKAMQQMVRLQGLDGVQYHQLSVSTQAYKMADAMLKARES